jgi:putative PEP-CTERM system histidine kinase
MSLAGLDLGVIGYGVAALFYLVLTLLLLTSWRGRLQGALLTLLSLVSTVWAIASSLQAAQRLLPAVLTWTLEALRMLLLLLFLLRLLEMQGEGRPARRLWLRGVRFATLAVCLLVLPLSGLMPAGLGMLPWALPDLRLTVQVLLAVTGLALVEQVYRNTPWEHRWGIKYLCIGLGTLLAYDLYLFSNALLFNHLDPDLWRARGAINALAVPLLGVSAARNPQWSLDLFVSRKIVFRTTAIFAAGIYLLVMAAAGYYIRIYGGQWSRVLEIVFMVGAGVVLLALLFSGRLRAHIKVLVNKHFFNYKYDYREEWLRLIGVLSDQSRLRAPLTERVIYCLGEIVDSPGGALWLCREGGEYRHRGQWNLPAEQFESDLPLGSLPAYLGDTQWVVNLDEYESDAELYEGLDLPDWLSREHGLWLVVPLFHEDQLLGFVVLARPRAPQNLDWETLDLLKTAGRQAASYLALEQAADALAEARQFEGFNRLSAFVMHDLKNLIAQLSLVAKNAERHRRNPEFIDDAILTIRNSVDKMNRLMAQLRGAAPERRICPVPLRPLLAGLVSAHSMRAPAPLLTRVPEGDLSVYGNPERLGSVIGHIIQNAQEATGARGRVKIRLARVGEQALVEIEDDGVGMDREFVRNRLFKPFDSTKGLTGMGVGAYDCRELVLSMGGRVEVQSALGQGTVFRIYLPVTGEPADAEVAARA